MFWRRRRRQPNRWRGMVLGVVGSLAGLVAMGLYRRHIAPLLRTPKRSGGDDEGNQEEQPLASLAIAGQHHKPDESATAALGRIFYQWAADEEPGPDAKSVLSNLVHWGYGMAQGAVYGFLNPRPHGPDLSNGLLFGAGLWFFGDELMVSALGLQEGPAATPPEQHLNRLGMHLAYGAGTALTTQLLLDLFGEE